MALDWDDFRLFAAVARAGSFTGAARELKLSEPTVSRRIKRLESSVGRKLLRHTAGRTYLTAEGQRILNYAIAAEYALAQAAHDKEPASEEPSLCRILAVDGVSTYWLPQFFAEFLKRHPSFDVALFTTQDRYSQKKPIYDLNLQYMETTAQHLVSVRVATVHFTPFAMRSYIQERGMPANAADLAHHRIVDLAFDMSDRGMLASVTRSYGRTALFTNSVSAMCEAIRYGGGIGLLPTYAALIEPDVAAVLPEINIEVPLFLSFERESGQHPAVRAMIDFLRRCVFDPRSMPWFASQYERPGTNWNRLYQKALLAAAAP